MYLENLNSNMKLLISFVIIISFITFLSALNVSQCYDAEKPFEGLEERVKLGNCKKPPCRLRKNTVITLELKLKPEQDVEKITNSISAFIAGVPFPFPGVDQTDACPLIYDATGKNKVGCPLKAGQEYVYVNPVEVLQIYPRIKTVVHWALTAPDGKDLICFEVPARITN